MIRTTVRVADLPEDARMAYTTDVKGGGVATGSRERVPRAPLGNGPPTREADELSVAPSTCRSDATKADLV